MDSSSFAIAIREAEREAELASKAAAAAATQLASWSEGERAVITSLKRLGAVISTPDFQAASAAFVATHKHIFTFIDENKLEYTTLHEAYVELMERTLIDNAPDVNIDELMANLPEFMTGSAQSHDPDGTGATLDFLCSLTDFQAFKDMMLASQIAESTIVASAGPDLSVLIGALERLTMPPELLAAVGGLLQLNRAADSHEWKPSIDDKKAGFKMETTSHNGLRYGRHTLRIDLPFDVVTEEFFNLEHPDYTKWMKQNERIEVLSKVEEGKTHDWVIRVHFKIPALARFLPGVPDHIVLRVFRQDDLPADGQNTMALVSWDPATNLPSSTGIGICKVLILRPNGQGTEQVTVERFHQAAPEWMLVRVMSSTVGKGMQQDVERFKQIKGIK
jgi:hypothetical protein